MAEQEMLVVDRFVGWSTESLVSQCRAQAREQLDPEYSAFMEAIANRLAATKAADERVRVMEKALIDIANEAERENGGWVHLKRVIGIKARVALSTTPATTDAIGRLYNKARDNLGLTGVTPPATSRLAEMEAALRRIEQLDVFGAGLDTARAIARSALNPEGES